MSRFISPCTFYPCLVYLCLCTVYEPKWVTPINECIIPSSLRPWFSFVQPRARPQTNRILSIGSDNRKMYADVHSYALCIACTASAKSPAYLSDIIAGALNQPLSCSDRFCRRRQLNLIGLQLLCVPSSFAFRLPAGSRAVAGTAAVLGDELKSYLYAQRFYSACLLVNILNILK